jgi:hypothetical protein
LHPDNSFQHLPLLKKKEIKKKILWGKKEDPSCTFITKKRRKKQNQNQDKIKKQSKIVKVSNLLFSLFCFGYCHAAGHLRLC